MLLAAVGGGIGVVVAGEEGVDRVERGRRQAREHVGAELILVGVDRRADDTLHAIGRGRLDREGAQAGVRSGRDGLDLLVAGDDVVAQPGGERMAVLDGGLAEPEGLADLRAMVLDRAAGPVILEVVLVGDADLRGEVRDDGAGDLVAVLREAAVVLEVEEQDGEAQARGARLVGQEGVVGGEQRPLLDQLVGLPVSLHMLLLHDGTRGRRRSAWFWRCRHS